MLEESFDEYWTERQTAEFLGMSVAWLRKLRSKSRQYGPPVHHFSRCVRYLRSEVVAWSNQQIREVANAR